MKQLLATLFIGITLIACNSRTAKQQAQAPMPSSFIKNEYSQGFSWKKVDDSYTLLEIHNPWRGGSYASYALIAVDDSTPTTLPATTQIIRTPIQSSICLSASQVGLFNALNALESITGVGSLKYLYNPTIHQKAAENQVDLVGYEGGLNLESIVELNPDVLIADGFETKNPNLVRLEGQAVPVLYFLDWMESEPLARLEWIKVIGLLLGKEQEANSYFELHRDRYLALKNQSNVSDTPYVFSGNNFKGTWYMAGGNSFLAHLFKDAGAKYRWEADSSKGSIPLSLEKVLNHHLEDDFWLNPNARSLKELMQTDQRYPLFKAFQEKRVYSPNKRIAGEAGNDYWESGMAQPDVLLKDMMSILHPDLFPDYETVYYQQLN